MPHGGNFHNNPGENFDVPFRAAVVQYATTVQQLWAINNYPDYDGCMAYANQIRDWDQINLANIRMLLEMVCKCTLIVTPDMAARITCCLYSH